MTNLNTYLPADRSIDESGFVGFLTAAMIVVAGLVLVASQFAMA